MIYIDSYFLINFGMNLFLLLICGCVRQENLDWKRIFLAAVCGGAAACIELLCPALHSKVGMMLILLFMCVIAYPDKNGKQMLDAVLLLFLAACTVGGLLDSMYYQEQKEGEVLSSYWLFQTLLYVLPITFAGIWVWNRGKKKRPIYRVILEYGEKRVETYGLWDTGNRLKTVAKSPVSLAEKELLHELLSEKEYRTLEQWPTILNPEEILIFPISYHCIGTELGLLPAIRIERMIIYKEKGIITIQNPIIGMGNNKFSKQNQYQMILNSEV